MKKVTIICLAVIISFFISLSVNSKSAKTTNSAVTNYQIISGTSLALLQRNVIREVASGWEPVGGITYNQTVYVQAMVK